LKPTADNLCALVIIVSMAISLTELLTKTMGTDGLLIIACLVLAARYYYVKARTP